MTDRPPASDATLRLNRTFAARRERVFKAWTDQEALRRWFAPSEEYTTRIFEMDLRPGGRYRLEMVSPAGESFRLQGTYRQVTPPEKLVYTWRWEHRTDPDARETLVTVEFRDRGESTEVVLTHELFPSLEEKDKHTKGWAGCLDRLEKFTAR